LRLFLLSRSPDFDSDGDDGDRHFANFLAWCDSVLVGIDRGIKKASDSTLARRWEDLRADPLRELMRNARNDALKGRREVMGDEVVADFGADGFLIAQRFGHSLGEAWSDAPVLGTCHDYLAWIQRRALPLLFEAVQLGSVGDDDRDAGQMPFPSAGPWTCDLAFDIRSVMRGLDPE